jgi:putative ABC transport system ATP-binding protein
VLSVRNLSVSVAGGRLFSPVDFELCPGQLLSVSGPSGVGKTSLLRAVSGVGPWLTGEMSLEGRSREEVGMQSWRRRVALVPQEPPPLTGSLLDFVRRVTGLRLLAERVTQQAFLGLITAKMERFRLKEGLLGTPFQQLSGGERTRLYLALVLATQPDVLLLDEPTSSLDSSSTRLVEAELEGRTGILVTHEAGQRARLAARDLELVP